MRHLQADLFHSLWMWTTPSYQFVKSTVSKRRAQSEPCVLCHSADATVKCRFSLNRQLNAILTVQNFSPKTLNAANWALKRADAVRNRLLMLTPIWQTPEYSRIWNIRPAYDHCNLRSVCISFDVRPWNSSYLAPTTQHWSQVTTLSVLKSRLSEALTSSTTFEMHHQLADKKRLLHTVY